MSTSSFKQFKTKKELKEVHIEGVEVLDAKAALEILEARGVLNRSMNLNTIKERLTEFASNKIKEEHKGLSLKERAKRRM